MPPATDTTQAASDALQADAGCTEDRADALISAVRAAAADEALAIVAGVDQSVGSAVDRRVATLHRIIGALPDTEALPNSYEIGAIFRITPEQGRRVLRTFQARFSKSYRDRLQAALAAAKIEKKSQNGTPVFIFSFNDPSVLEYAIDRLRRRGLTRSVIPDRTKLTLIVNRAERDRFGQDAETALR